MCSCLQSIYEVQRRRRESGCNKLNCRPREQSGICRFWHLSGYEFKEKSYACHVLLACLLACLPACLPACLLLILDKQPPGKPIFQRPMGQRLADRDHVTFWLSFCYRSVSCFEEYIIVFEAPTPSKDKPHTAKCGPQLLDWKNASAFRSTWVSRESFPFKSMRPVFMAAQNLFLFHKMTRTLTIRCLFILLHRK